MKFIKELIANKSWSSSREQAEFGEETLRRDMEEGGFESPLVDRAQQIKEAADAPVDESAIAEDLENFAAELESNETANGTPDDTSGDADTSQTGDADAVADTAKTDSQILSGIETASPLPTNRDDADGPADGEWFDDFDNPEMEELEDDEVEAWNIGLSDDALAEAVDEEARNVVPQDFSPEEEQEVFDDPLFHDEEHSAKIEAAALEAVHSQELSELDKEALVEEIRNAMQAVRHIHSDEELDRQAHARGQLGPVEDAAEGNRIFDATDTIMAEDKGARRRQAIALMKTAAQATRADPVLQDMAGHDPSANQAETSDYRDDLESYEKPRLTRSRNLHASEGADAPTDWASDPAADESTPVVDEAARDAETEVPTLGADDTDMPKPGDLSHEPEGSTEPEQTEAGEQTPEISAEATKTVEQTATPEHDDTVGDGDAEDAPKSSAHDELRAALEAARRPKSETVEDGKRPVSLADVGGIEMSQEEADASEADESMAPTAEVVQVPPPSMGRSRRQAGRVKTRLLGFQHDDDAGNDPFDNANSPSQIGDGGLFPVGWLALIDGPSCGHTFALSAGVTQIGRGEGQAVRLDFGDTAVSRENHAAIAYDDEQNRFFLGQGGKSNIVRLNGTPVLSTESLQNGDQIRIGETTLRFVALCDQGFSWVEKGGDDVEQAAIA